MRPIRTAKAAGAAAQFESLGTLLSSHRAITRVSLAAISFTLLIAFSQQAPAQAGPESAPVIPESLLPLNVGIAVETDGAITIPFDTAMDRASVESALQVLPEQNVQLVWDEAGSALTIQPDRLWRTDERYLVVVGASSSTSDGATLRGAKRYSFTTETAPAITDFQVRLATADLPLVEGADAATELSTRNLVLDADSVAAAQRDAATSSAAPGATSQPPTRAAKEVSATSSISIDFSELMNRNDVESHFAISPAISGDLSWSGDHLIFRPSERLVAGTRYTITLIGSHDARGNLLGGKGNFSFTVQPGAQLTKTSPGLGADGIEPAVVEMWFSQPMNTDSANKAFALRDLTTGALVAGNLEWNDAGTQVTYTPDAAFAQGHAFQVQLAAKAARDADGNAIGAVWSFTTKAAPVVAAPVARSTATTRSAPAIPRPAPSSSLAGYALNQVNAARAAYGFAPLVLDASVSAVAYAHAYDQAVNNYFSHYGLNGSTRETRLRAGGVSFGWSGENQCYHVGMSQQATLDWCHAQFMAEPYPGQWNHIANILNPNARRMGVGIATVGGKTVMTWDFTD